VYVNQLLPEKIRRQLEYCRRATMSTDLAVLGQTARILLLRIRTASVDALVRFRRPFVVATHVALIMVGYRLAFELRFDYELPSSDKAFYWYSVPLLVILRLAIYFRYGLHLGYWRHVSAEDLATICRAVTVGSVAFLLTCIGLGWIPGMPRSVFLLDWVIAIFLTGGVRFAVRRMLEAELPVMGRPCRRTLVVGAGNRAEQLVREIRREAGTGLEVVGLVVDHGEDRDRTIHNVRVVGTIDRIVDCAQRQSANLVIIALDLPTVDQTQRIVSQCTSAGLEFKTVPTLRELLEGSARAHQLRSLRLEDLLGRAEVLLDMAAVEAELRGKTVLVTGGAGSIGGELANQIARCHPAHLILMDQAESSLYFVTLDLQGRHPGLSLQPVVCDIANPASFAQVFADHQPDYVFHAAAYKHVPMMELNVLEAVRNNVFGTLLVADAAATWGAAKFVLISTDKAVNPSSIMGASKRLAERLILGLPSLQKANTDFRAVRFGNVLGSAGSVVPLFERQLVAGGPLTVTHPDVERYFMTIQEAVQLVLHAAILPEASRRITLLDMGEPVRILDLAEKMIRLAGQEPYRDVQIMFTGLRPGEKLREELLSETEATIPTQHRKIRIVDNVEDDSHAVRAGVERLLRATRAGDVEGLLEQIRLLVPKCEPPLRGERPCRSTPPRRSPPVGLHSVPALDALYREGF
jgi:FlaA1/EpsC-like NDP-sugar epimerase